MEHTHSYYEELMKRYIENRCTPAEAEEILDYLQRDEAARDLLTQLQEQFRLTIGAPTDTAADSTAPGISTAQSQRMRQDLLRQLDALPQTPAIAQTADIPPPATPAEKPARIFSLRRIRTSAAAAILLITLSGITYYLFHKTTQPAAAPVASLSTPLTDPQPGSAKAILTLADGSDIVLDSAHNGSIGQQGRSNVMKLRNGLLAYEKDVTSPDKTHPGARPSDQPGAITFNTITTPRGGTYRVILPDGTQVWMNADAYLRFPTAFEGKERRVQLSGEAYFEVAKDPSRPFRISIAPAPGETGPGTEVEVLGTIFNVMAYKNEEDIKTTLLDGTVKVTKGTATGILQQGQEATVNKAASSLRASPANGEAAIAWKKGLFQFEETGIRTVMNELSRWYDVDISYEGSETKHFTGMMPRTVSLSKVLKIMEVAGKMHFRTEGRKIIAE